MSSPQKITKEEAREVREYYEQHGLFWIQTPDTSLDEKKKDKGKP